jgi:hypothetical protein
MLSLRQYRFEGMGNYQGGRREKKKIVTRSFAKSQTDGWIDPSRERDPGAVGLMPVAAGWLSFVELLLGQEEEEEEEEGQCFLGSGTSAHRLVQRPEGRGPAQTRTRQRQRQRTATAKPPVAITAVSFCGL